MCCGAADKVLAVSRTENVKGNLDGLGIFFALQFYVFLVDTEQAGFHFVAAAAVSPGSIAVFILSRSLLGG